MHAGILVSHINLRLFSQTQIWPKLQGICHTTSVSAAGTVYPDPTAYSMSNIGVSPYMLSPTLDDYNTIFRMWLEGGRE